MINPIDYQIARESIKAGRTRAEHVERATKGALTGKETEMRATAGKAYDAAVTAAPVKTKHCFT